MARSDSWTDPLHVHVTLATQTNCSCVTSDAVVSCKVEWGNSNSGANIQILTALVENLLHLYVPYRWPAHGRLCNRTARYITGRPVVQRAVCFKCLLARPTSE